MKAILDNQIFVYFFMAIFVFAITQGMKWVLVKPWTNKLENERLRKAINSIIFFFPYFVAIAMEFAFSVIVKVEFNAWVGLVIGGGSHSVYGIFEMIYGIATGKIKIDKNESNKEIIEEFIEKNKEEHTALDAFWNKIK